MADEGQATTPLLEWGAGLLGLVIVVGAVGFLAYAGLEPESPYPDVDVQVVDIQPQDNGYVVAFEARNRGGATAQNVVVRGRMETPDGVTVRQAQVDYIPAGSTRSGGLFFRDDPRRHPLALDAEGYTQP